MRTEGENKIWPLYAYIQDTWLWSSFSAIAILPTDWNTTQIRSTLLWVFIIADAQAHVHHERFPCEVLPSAEDVLSFLNQGGTID